MRSGLEDKGHSALSAVPRLAAVQRRWSGGHEAGRAAAAPFVKQIHRHEAAARSMSSSWARVRPGLLALFPNTKAAEDLTQQIIRAEGTGDLAQRIVRQAQVFGKQVQRRITGHASAGMHMAAG